jgi:hypothetical protein
MFFLFESIFVGVYSVILVFIVSAFFSFPFILLLFIVGFLKHLFGYLLGLQNMYCKYGYACNRDPDKLLRFEIVYQKVDIFVDSIIEGFMFSLFGYFISLFINKNKYITVFFIGVLLHILAELFGIHSEFCNSKCEKK